MLETLFAFLCQIGLGLVLYLRPTSPPKPVLLAPSNRLYVRFTIVLNTDILPSYRKWNSNLPVISFRSATLFTMPVLLHRQQVYVPRSSGSARNSTGSNESAKEHLWVVEEDYERPQKEMDSPSAKLGKMSYKPNTRNPPALRIDTYSKADLQDRYLSSEEELSPSPLDDDRHDDNELEPKAEICMDDTLDLSIIEYKAEIAVAVPILAYGRPKLIDITNLAPMHKRKRSSVSKMPIPHPTIRTTASHAPMARDENTPPVKDIIEVTVIPEKQAAPAQLKRRESYQLKRIDSFPMSAPESWFPEEDPEQPSVPDVDPHPLLRYRDRDTMSLRAPRLYRLQNFSGRHRSGSVNGSLPALNASGLKNLTRSMSLIKRQSTQLQPEKQVTKKPKMIARGASERQEMPIIPPFPFKDEVAVA